jgi:hypothetical protein
MSRQNSQIRVEDTRFAQSLFIQMNTSGRRVGNGVQDGRDVWRTVKNAPDTIVGARRPPSKDADRECHAADSNGDPPALQVPDADSR